MRIECEKLLNELSEETKDIIRTVESEFKDLNEETLSLKPGAGQWSILEIFDHLNILGNIYIPGIKRGLKKASSSKPVPAYKPGWMGNRLVKNVTPSPSGKIKPMKTMKFLEPEVASGSSKKPVKEFLEHQYEILDLIEKSRNCNLGKVRVKSSLGNIIRFKLGDTFRFLVGHNRRHLMQAENTLEKIKSTSVT